MQLNHVGKDGQIVQISIQIKRFKLFKAALSHAD